MPNTPKLNIVCALKTNKKSVSSKVGEPYPPTIVEEVTSEFQLEKQHGSWNKRIVKWWVKGEVDEFFDERQYFMRRVFNTAFTEWDIEIPLIFIQADSEDDADIIIEWGVRANDRYYSGDNGRFVLAYAGYPDGALKGYMKIFTDWSWDVQGTYNLVTLITHELGHLIGRPHSERRIWEDIMDPIINERITELSDHDIAGAVAEYGAREYAQPAHHSILEGAHRRSKERLKRVELKTIPTKS